MLGLSGKNFLNHQGSIRPSYLVVFHSPSLQDNRDCRQPILIVTHTLCSVALCFPLKLHYIFVNVPLYLFLSCY